MVPAWRPGSKPPVLEREPQLAVLQEAMAAAAAGQGGLVFVTGEAGVGKTALVRRFATSCSEVILGTCDPLETPRPLRPLFDMAPHLGADFQALMAASPSRFEIFGALADRLASAAGPPLLVFEDVHWGDQATLDLLRFLGRRVERLPALVLATAREEELGPGS